MSRLITAFVGVALLVALFVGGSQPGAAGLVPEPWDKLAHVGVFVSLTLALAHGFLLPVTLATVAAMLLGVADELHQAFLPGRVASTEDLLADLIGVAAATCTLLWRRRSATPGVAWPAARRAPRSLEHKASSTLP